MAGSTDYQLATMKVNLTQLSLGAKALSTSIQNQKVTVTNFHLMSRGAEQALFPTKQRLIEILDTHQEDATLLNDRVEHIYNILPKIKKYNNGKIDENGNRLKKRKRAIGSLQARRIARYPDSFVSRPKRFFPQFIWGIIGTFQGIINEKKYRALSESLARTQDQLANVVDVVNKQGQNIATIDNDLKQLSVTMTKSEILHSLNTETHLRSANLRLSTEVTRITSALQMAQLRRLSIDFLTSNQLDSLYSSMIDSSERAGSELLIYQPSDMFQLELSYFFDGEIITFLLHVPTVPRGTMLRLIKLHPFPMPLSGQYSILPDIENQVLAISSTGRNISLQFPSINLLGCDQTNHVYLCEKLGTLGKDMTRTCLGALYKQKFDIAKVLCPMKIVTSGEISYRLKNNKHLIYSPISQTIPIRCPSKTQDITERFVPSGVSEIQLEAGCQSELENSILFSDNSITSATGLDHITLNRDFTLDIPNITPKDIEDLVTSMSQLGILNPTMNDIIEASDHLDILRAKTPFIGSIISWVLLIIIIIFIVAFLYFYFNRLKTLYLTLLSTLDLKTFSQFTDTIQTFFTAFNPKPITNKPPSNDPNNINNPNNIL